MCCSEVSISPLFRWPNSVNHFKRRSDIREWVGAEVRVVLEKQTTKNTEPKSLAQSILLSALEVFSE
ncbi:hypothetical protein EIZ92_25635 [Escherichia coli]|nr:hypothetical protein [Escherichia coli]